ncbi:MAG: hypothetical protein AB9903_22535 [Vulcanimicrobiota bacterium]
MRIGSGDIAGIAHSACTTGKPVLFSADSLHSRDSIELSERAGSAGSLRYFSSVPAPSVGQTMSAGAGSPVNEKEKPSEGAPLTIAEKSRLLGKSGFSFFTEDGTPVSLQDLLRYCREGNAPSPSLTVQKGNLNVTLPFTEQSVDAVLFFHTDAAPSGLKLPRYAESVRKLYSMDFPMYRRVKGDDGSYPFVKLEPLEACREAETLTPLRKPGTRIFFRDGDTYCEIDKDGDFKRAEVLKGLKDESELNENERKALPLVRMMLDRGALFTEKEFNGDKGLKTGILSLVKAVGGEGEGVYYYDSQKRKSDIRSLRDLERIGYVYYRDAAGPADLSPEEKSLIRQIDDLIQKGVVFRDDIFDKTYGIPMVLKSILGENNSMIAREYVSIHDEAGRDTLIDCPEDLARIRAIYVDRDISTLPSMERKILVSLGRIYNLKGDPAPPSAVGIMASMKNLLPGSRYPASIGVIGRPPGIGNAEELRTLKDVDRYVAVYIDKKPDSLPPDEQEALSIMDSIRASGLEFGGTLNMRIPTVGVLQILKGEHPYERSVGLMRMNAQQGEGSGKSDSSLPRVRSLQDLRRIDALMIRKDPRLLSEDEYNVLQRIEELGKSGITFRGELDSSFISVLKALKGETRKAFMIHPDNRRSMINEMRDLDRIEAIYLGRGLSALPAEEAEMIQDLQLLQSAGFSCVLARDGRLNEAAILDVLKSGMSGGLNVGIKDSRGAFTVVSSPEDVKNLKSVAKGEEPQFATGDEAELYRKAAVLAGRRYSLKAHMAFRPETSPTISIPEEHDFTISALQLVKEMMKGGKGVYAEKEGVTAPFSSLIECLDFVEKSESGDREASEAPADNAIVEDDGFIVVGGIRLAINKKAS